MASSSRSGIGPVVSASHLAEGDLPALSELEFALMVLGNAFQRWIVRGMASAGYPGLGHVDVLILHAIAHRGRDKTQAELCAMYNIEDTHVVTYALRKLESLGLIEKARRGKEKVVRPSREGRDACERYREVRERLLVGGVRAIAFDEEAISGMAATMHALSGQYDQASRAAASL